MPSMGIGKLADVGGADLGTFAARMRKYFQDDPAAAADFVATLDAARPELPADYVEIPGVGLCWRPVEEQRHAGRPFVVALIKSGTWAATGDTTWTLASTIQDLLTALTGQGRSYDDLGFVLESISIKAKVTSYDNVDANTDGIADSVHDAESLSDVLCSSALFGFTVDGQELHPGGQTLDNIVAGQRYALAPVDPVAGGDVAGVYIAPDRLSTSDEFAMAVVAPAAGIAAEVSVVAQLVIRPVPLID